MCIAARACTALSDQLQLSLRYLNGTTRRLSYAADGDRATRGCVLNLGLDPDEQAFQVRDWRQDWAETEGRPSTTCQLTSGWQILALATFNDTMSDDLTITNV
jgi:hypothetical protein